MGYATWHSLVVHSEKSEEIISELRKENEHAEYAFDEQGCGQEWERWSKRDKEMCEFSLRHPGILFEIDCEGEDHEQWRSYYKDGKFQEISPVITWPEFDYEALKEPN